MIPTELVERHRTIQEGIETLAYRDLLDVWRRTDLTDARAATDQLLPAIRDITTAYGDTAATTAADFYDDARAASGPPGSFRATAARPAPTGQIDAMVRWAVTPIWSTDPRATTALTLLAGGTQRLIRRADRDTIVGSGRRDPQATRWARVARPGACDFCVMLASRGHVYTSRAAATQVVGREHRRFSRPGRRGASTIVGRAGRRGTRDIGERFHDHCRCTTVPLWSAEDHVPAEL